MNIEDRATPPPLFPVVSKNDSDIYSIGVPQLSYRETLGYYGPTSSPIPPKPPLQKSLEEGTEGAHLQEATERENPGCPIWERGKSN